MKADIYRIIGHEMPICLWALCILSSIGLCVMHGWSALARSINARRCRWPLIQGIRQLEVAGPKDTIVRGQWWSVFQDAQLNDLEDRVDRGNQTIAAAAANYEAARAIVRESRSQYFPSVTTNPAITYSQGLHRHDSRDHEQGVYRHPL